MSEKNETVEFPINQELLSEATKIKEQWKVLKDRVQKIEEHKDKVSKQVYMRVKTDYEQRLEEITKEILEKKNAIDHELVSLYETQKKIASELDSHRQKLEEIKFRNVLGEFSEEEYQTNAKDEQDKISKFETILSAVNTNISRYEELFHDEIAVLSIHEKIVTEEIELPPEEVEMAPEERPAEEAIAPENYEAGYFTGYEESTQETVDQGEQPENKLPLKNARIVIINGDDAGATYPIKDVITFGRSDSNTVALHDAKVSRQHAKILQKGDEFVLIDLNSSNGTYVNGARIEEHVLSNNDEFQIGDSTMQFQR